MKPVLVIVSGPPGAGKTTLAKRLGAEVGLPIFDRDDLKDVMFDALGWSDRKWSMKIGAASYELLYLIVERLLLTGVSLIAETNFNGPLAREHLSVIRERTGCHLIEVHCFAAPEVLLQRFRDRWESGGRHPGHVAHELPLEEASLGAEFAVGNPAVAVGDELIEVDTTDPERIDWEQVVARVRQELGEMDESRDR